MSEAGHVTAREFEARIADLREDHHTLASGITSRVDQLRSENTEDHLAVVARLEQIEKRLGAAVTWPSLVSAVAVACAVIGLVLGIAK